MNPVETARATATTIGRLPSYFMLDAETYGRGTELGFNGMDFYLAGRCGVLGDTSAGVVTAALVFFEPGTVQAGWEATAPVMSRADASAEFMACGYAWATAHLNETVDWSRLAELSAKAAVGTSPSCAPLFAAWRSAPAPDGGDPRAAALHHLNVLRELRMALHGAAVLAAGVSPLEAMMVRTPQMVQVFGWSEPFPDADAVRDRWTGAEEATDAMMARAFVDLSGSERAELADLCQAAKGARV